MPGGSQGARKRNANGSGPTCKKDIHDMFYVSRAHKNARPEPSISMPATIIALAAKSARH
jgi:hypothetical protein